MLRDPAAAFAASPKRLAPLYASESATADQDTRHAESARVLGSGRTGMSGAKAAQGRTRYEEWQCYHVKSRYKRGRAESYLYPAKGGPEGMLSHRFVAACATQWNGLKLLGFGTAFLGLKFEQLSPNRPH
jgi:hypothetical protein